ncbi:Ankyrin-1 [Fusarium culmorum]|uniref:Ankyrin-1 n=1 Tax=Fusarium culmorum TaxID=5516 RepID=A0A2T4GVG3_FUSCU|nr:Ankyrin-1 [Fusarium culmorum]
MIDYNAYTIGWICAIRAELVAAQELLDEELMDPVPTSKNDNNTYTLGKIGPHHVVIAGLPRGEYGETTAAAAARDMVHTFPNVRIGFMVGIGGGVPTEYDVRLGDVVVGSPSYRSGGLIKYDHGRAVQGGGTDLMGSLNQPPVSILTAITKLSAFHDRRGHNLNQTVDDVLAKNQRLVRLGYRRPPDDTDRLYEAGFIHPYHGEKCSVVCPDTNLKPRQPRLEYEDNPKIHYGLIASGSKLMEDSIARDQLAESEHVLCFEMEAAGLANHFPCVAIRGICDYSDSHRGRTWQGYAALVAAAYAKELLLQISPENIKQEERMTEILQGIEDVKAGLEPLAKTSENVESLNDRSKREEELKIIDWLNAVDYASEQHGFLKPEQRLPGTGQQFLSSESFQTWLKTRSSLLFCSGMPGAGKTITTAITVEHLYSTFRDNPTVGVAYVYCSYQKRDQQKPQDLFTSLLKQLALSMSPFPKAMYELHEKNHNGRERPSFEDIVATLCKVVNAFSTTFIVIDALDEHDSWDTFLSDVIVLRKRTTANIFITSRPRPTLPDELKGCLMHDIQADEEDVALYINQRMAKMMVISQQNVDLSKKAKDDCRNLIREKLGKAVNGIFLLARIYLDSLMEETNLKGISDFLKNLSTGLRAYADAYEKTIRRIRNQGQKQRDLARRALTWLMFARKSLTREQFRHALSVEDGMSELKDEDLHSTNIIQHVCMGLVMVDAGSRDFRLLHFTTMEYLKANPNCLLSLESSDDPNFIEIPADSEIERSLARKHYETKLATTCATYLLFEDFSRGYVLDRKFDSPLYSRLQKHPLSYYAANNWGHHARHGEPSTTVLDFLKSKPHANASSQYLLRYYGYLVDEYKGLYPVTGLHLTALFGLKTETASLLSSGMEPDARDAFGRTPLSHASELGYTDVVVELLKFPVDTDSKSNGTNNSDPRSALDYAAQRGHTQIVKLLIEKGRARPDGSRSIMGNKEQRTPLSFASEAGYLDVVNILLRTRKVDPNSTDFDGRTPLHFAVKCRDEVMVKLLLATEGINPNLYDYDGMTPLHYAIESGGEAVVKLLLATGKAHPEPRNDVLRSHFTSISEPHPIPEQTQSQSDTVKATVVNGCVDVNAKAYGGLTPLSYAVFHNRKSMVKLLLDRTDVELNTQDGKGKTALRHAVHSDTGTVKLLLACKSIRPNLADENGRTPFLYAAERAQKLEVLKLFIADARVEVDSRDRSGRTPLSYLAERAQMILYSIYFHEGYYDILVRGVSDKDKFKFLDLEKMSDRIRKLVRELVVHREANPFSRDEQGRTPVYMMPELVNYVRERLLQQ